jgi:hypothetical protein
MVPGTPSFGVIGDLAEAAGSYLFRHGKSLLLSVLDLLPIKADSPHSTALLKHYVEASGDPYELKEIPIEWQDWIVKGTKGKPGIYKGLSPYNVGLYDLQHALGHFDVRVKANADGTRTYVISDLYRFGSKRNDRRQQGRHGFVVGDVSESSLRVIRTLLPSTEYENPGGFKERWEIKTVHYRDGKSQTILFVPQQFLVEQGREFAVRGEFTR